MKHTSKAITISLDHATTREKIPNNYNDILNDILVLIREKNYYWECTFSGIDSKPNSDGNWTLSKSLCNPRGTIQPIHGPSGIAYDAESKADAMADTLEHQF